MARRCRPGTAPLAGAGREGAPDGIRPGLLGYRISVLLERLLLLLEGICLFLVRLCLGALLSFACLVLTLALLGVTLGAQVLVVGDVAELLLGDALDVLPHAHQLSTDSFHPWAVRCARSAAAPSASCFFASASARTALMRSVPFSCCTSPALARQLFPVTLPTISLPRPTTLLTRPSAFLLSMRGICIDPPCMSVAAGSRFVPISSDGPRRRCLMRYPLSRASNRLAGGDSVANIAMRPLSGGCFVASGSVAASSSGRRESNPHLLLGRQRLCH